MNETFTAADLGGEPGSSPIIPPLHEQFVAAEQTKPTKGELLDKYCKREPTQFIQYDGFLERSTDEKDYMFQYDKDGDYLFPNETWELMYGANVRVLISPNTTAKEVRRLLKKISKDIDFHQLGRELLPCLKPAF